MPRPLVAITDVRALRANLAVARAAVPQAKIWAVVKADAYGHGLDAALQGFAQADGLSLIEWDAAVRLRESGWQKPILMLEGLFEPADLAVAERHRLALESQQAVLGDELVAGARVVVGHAWLVGRAGLRPARCKGGAAQLAVRAA